MRFPLAWAEIASQNNVLKAAILALSLCVIGLLLTALRHVNKDPLIIERACYLTPLKAGEKEITEADIKAFLKLAVEARFDSNATQNQEFLSAKEQQFRALEQKKLLAKKIRQKVIVNDVNIKAKPFEVDADRLLSVGSIRSVLAFPLKINLVTTDRTASNPYGLKVLRVSAPKSNKKDGKNE